MYYVIVAHVDNPWLGADVEDRVQSPFLSPYLTFLARRSVSRRQLKWPLLAFCRSTDSSEKVTPGLLRTSRRNRDVSSSPSSEQRRASNQSRLDMVSGTRAPAGGRHRTRL